MGPIKATAKGRVDWGTLKKIQCFFRILASLAKPDAGDDPDTIYPFVVADIDGNEVSLETFRGQVFLVVNVASRCGFTKQYEGLERLYRQFKEQGFVILGFPSNNFLWQEPGSNQQIKYFCSTRYQVSFPLFSKVSVRGKRCCPLYRWLVRRSEPRKPVEWNFVKFLVDRQGRVVARFGPTVKPEDKALIQAIEDAVGSSE